MSLFYCILITKGSNYCDFFARSYQDSVSSAFKRGKYLAIDTTNELLYLATIAAEILKLDATGGIILKNKPYS